MESRKNKFPKAIFFTIYNKSSASDSISKFKQLAGDNILFSREERFLLLIVLSSIKVYGVLLLALVLK